MALEPEPFSNDAEELRRIRFPIERIKLNSRSEAAHGFKCCRQEQDQSRVRTLPSEPHVFNTSVSKMLSTRFKIAMEEKR
jgi:hypothetical protein